MAQSINPADRPACRPGQPCRMNGLRILLVDDDPARLAQRLQAFERHGFDVLVASDPHTAISTLRTGMVCDIAVVELTSGAGDAVCLVNALRGLRAWLPAVIIGSGGLPAGAALTDPGVQTMWMPRAESPLALSSAIMGACCPGREPVYCPFRGLIGSARRSPDRVAPMAASWPGAAPRPRVIVSTSRVPA